MAITRIIVFLVPLLWISCSEQEETDTRMMSESEVGEYVTSNFDVDTLAGRPKLQDLTDEEKVQLLSDFRSGSQQFDFYAAFTEPFRTFYFFDNQVMIIEMDTEIPEVLTLEYPFRDSEAEQELHFVWKGELREMRIKKGQGTDGMSELNYPYEVYLNEFIGGGSTEFVKNTR